MANTPRSFVRLLLENDVLSFAILVVGAQPQIFSAPIARIREVLVRGNLTGQRLEEMIAITEDIIMPITRSLPAGANLEVCGPALEDIVKLQAAGGSAAIPIDSIELLFNQLADHAGGSAVAWHQAIDSSQAALGLVVLREIMHHGGFRTVSLERDDR